MSDDLLNALKRSVEMRSDAKPVRALSDEAKEIERLRSIGTHDKNHSRGVEHCVTCNLAALARRLLLERNRWEEDALQKLNDYKLAMIDKASCEKRIASLEWELTCNCGRKKSSGRCSVCDNDE